MHYSRLLIPTLKEDPAEAEVVSHRLLMRAGYIRKLAAGIYSYLPAGLRVLRKVERIIREEMDRAGAQEVLLPAVRRASYETLIVADGFSCRTQIAQATDRRALHLAEVIDMVDLGGVAFRIDCQWDVRSIWHSGTPKKSDDEWDSPNSGKCF